MTVLGELFRASRFAITTLGFSVLALGVAPFDRRGRWIAALARTWGRQAVRGVGVELSIEGPPASLSAPAYLVMANHTSHFDVPCLFAALPLDLRPVAKRELGYIPVFGWALWLGAAIMVDRGNRRSAIRSMEKAGRAIREGRSVLMFPEGTRTPKGELGPMKKGAFYLAQAARVPVVPVALVGTAEVLERGDWRIRPGRVVVRMGAPIPTDCLPEGEPGREALSAAVASALRGLMAEGGGPAGQVA